MKDQLKHIMADVLSVDPDSINENTTQDSLPRWDSLGHMNLCMALEEEFNTRFTDRQVVEMTSFEKVVAVLEAAVTR